MKKILTSIGIAAGLVAAASSANAAGPNLVTNGGFEQTTLTATGRVAESPDASSMPGWTVTVNNDTDTNINILYFSAADATTNTIVPVSALWSAQDSPAGGKFFAEDGDPTVPTSLSQTINGLTVGNTYQLSFEYAGAQMINRTGATTESWQVSFGDQTQTAATLSTVSKGFSGWFNSTMEFTATAASQSLSFMAVGTPAGLPPVSLLDGISLVDTTPPVTPVPEPATWATMILGLGVIGASLRRRSKGNDAA